MKDSHQRSAGTRQRSHNSAEAKLIELLERQLADLQQANAKLLRMVELVMEERFYRPTITGGVRENRQTPGLPLESLSDVATFDEVADGAQSRQENERFSELEYELQEIEVEHRDWRAEKGLASEANPPTVSAA